MKTQSVLLSEMFEEEEYVTREIEGDIDKKELTGLVSDGEEGDERY